jgi:hypothetical protein
VSPAPAPGRRADRRRKTSQALATSISGSVFFTAIMIRHEKPVPPTAKFCPECAHAAGRATAQRRPPRLIPYTPDHLGQRILTSRCRWKASASRSRGTVNQVMGDGIMALFGAPLAHENHAVRACHAALRVQESVPNYLREAECPCGVTFGR